LRYARLLGLLAALAVALVPPAGAREQRLTRSLTADRAAVTDLLARIAVNRDATWQWERTMQHQRTPSEAGVSAIRSVPYGRWVLALWRQRALAARRQAMNPPHKRAWVCIHRYEAGWTDAGGPYYGGLQMDVEFQTTFGRGLYRRKGTADHWTPLEQMWAAERAYRTRGFWPWPNTARYCGLL